MKKVSVTYHGLERIRERILDRIERAMDSDQLQAWANLAWESALSVETVRDPDSPESETLVASVPASWVDDRPRYLVGRADRNGVIVIVSALDKTMYERNRRCRWRVLAQARSA